MPWYSRPKARFKRECFFCFQVVKFCIDGLRCSMPLLELTILLRRKFQDECKQIERLIKRPRYPLAYGADNYGKSPQNISDARGFADTIIRTTTTRGCFLTSGSRRARAEFCAFVLRSVRKALVPVLWTDANSIVTDILSTWSDGRQYSEDAMINFYKMTPLLIVDDFGMQAGFRERQKFCVHGIIGARQTGASNEHEHQTQFS